MTKVEWKPMKTPHPMFPLVRDGEAVLAHTPLIQPPGCTPGYIILRETAAQYVVHNAEVDEAGRFVGLYWGFYVDKNEPDALKRAMERFTQKLIRWHNLKIDF
jgi:hypothetical protein